MVKKSEKILKILKTLKKKYIILKQFLKKQKMLQKKNNSNAMLLVFQY